VYGDNAFDFEEVQDLRSGAVEGLGATGDFKNIDGEFEVKSSDVSKIVDAAGQAFNTYTQVEGAKDILDASRPRPLGPYPSGQVVMPAQQTPYKKWVITALVVAGIAVAGAGIWYVMKSRKRKKKANPGPGRWTRFKQLVEGE
jgi:lysozyme family protein